MIVLCVSDVFLPPWWPLWSVIFVAGPPEIDAQGILLVGKLFGEIPGITPE